MRLTERRRALPSVRSSGPRRRSSLLGQMSGTRRFPRVIVNLQAVLWSDDSTTTGSLKARLTELDPAGSFVVVQQHHQRGTVVELRFRIPGAAEPIACTAVVRDVRRGEGIGIEFLDMSEGHRRDILDFISTLEAARPRSWRRVAVGRVAARPSKRRWAMQQCEPDRRRARRLRRPGCAQCGAILHRAVTVEGDSSITEFVCQRCGHRSADRRNESRPHRGADRPSAAGS